MGRLRQCSLAGGSTSLGTGSEIIYTPLPVCSLSLLPSFTVGSSQPPAIRLQRSVLASSAEYKVFPLNMLEIIGGSFKIVSRNNLESSSTQSKDT